MSKKPKERISIEPQTKGWMDFGLNAFVVTFVIFLVSVLLGDTLEARGVPRGIILAGKLWFFIFLGLVGLYMGMDFARAEGVKGWFWQILRVFKWIFVFILIFCVIVLGFAALVARASHSH